MNPRVLRVAFSLFVCLALLATFSTSGAQALPRPGSKGPHIRLAVGEFDPLIVPEPAGMPNALRLSAYAGDGTGYYLVQFQGPIANTDVDALTTAGAEVFDYIPDFTFIVKMDDATRTAIEHLDQVRWMGIYQPAYRLPADLLAKASDGIPISRLSKPSDGRQIGNLKNLWDDSPIEVIVTVFRGEELAPIIAQIEDMGGIALDQSQTEWKSKLKVSIPPSGLTGLVAIQGVRWVEEAPEWELANSEADNIMGVREVWDTHGLYGDGQTIAVCDTGLDQGSTSPASLHDDFEDGSGNSRVLAIHDRVSDGANDVNSGHGTHVAGSVLGNGDLSGATPGTQTYPDTAHAGMAPEASLVFQAVEDNSSGSLAGIPLDLNTLFAQAAGSGADLHTNSWGSAAMGMYTSDSEDIDEYVWDHKDFTILFAAGNDGIDSNADGIVDLYSMGSPGTAKNCITVGASENNRSSGGYNPGGACSAWGNCWPTDYPSNPIRDDRLSDDPSGMAAFSSHGPALDGRFKPDLVAPGTNIASVKSSATTQTGWGPINSYYTYMGGTSMATPLAAGAATVVRQYYADQEGITPSAALIKATMANGATDINPGQYGTGTDREIPGARPTNVAGWGRVDLENSVFPTSPRTMLYHDETTGLNTGGSDTYNYDVTSTSEPFRVTLAWSDYPGSPAAAGGLVNDLDLKITGPGSTTYYPENASQRGASQHLTYDDGIPSDGYQWSAGIRVAVRFTPTSYPATLQTGLFYVASDSYPKTFNWYVYDGNSTSGPNSVLASGSTTIRRLGWHAVDLSGAGVTISSGDFFLAIRLPDSDLVWFFDASTPVDTRSWDYSGGFWSNWLDNDYMFNAIVKSADASTNQDRVNNLVGIDIDTPATGTYVVTVSGYNVPHGPQPYALVASGAIESTAAAPTVTSITPNSGVNDGTVSITNLAGSNFQSGATVKLTKSGQPNINATNVVVVSLSKITCDFDLTGATTGAWNVVVTNPDSQSGTLSNGFTVNDPSAAPTVTSITPNSGFNNGTVSITNLAGSNFQSGATVKLTKSGQPNINATNVVVVSSSKITCDFDLTGAATGAWNVVVTNPDSQSGTRPNGFTVNAPFVYLPLVMRRWPPIPYTPVLNAISNPDGDGNYTVSWNAADLANTYTLQEDDNASFSSPTTRYTGYGTSWNASNKPAGTYYYQVRANNSWGSSGWSNVQSVSVQPPPMGVTNGDFESGPTGWVEHSTHGWDLIVTDFPGTITPHSGSWAVWLGGEHNEISYIQQQVTVPPGSAYLAYWHWIASEDLCGYDFGGVIIDGSTVVDVYDLCTSTNTVGWVKHVVNLNAYAGQTVAIQIRSETDSSLNSSLFVDDVAFQTSPSSVQDGPTISGPGSTMPKSGNITPRGVEMDGAQAAEILLRQE